MLTIALEPEAASLYCRHLPVEKCGSGKTSLATFGPGKRYLVLDAGGIFPIYFHLNVVICNF
jgi:hypothetical protein